MFSRWKTRSPHLTPAVSRITNFSNGDLGIVFFITEFNHPLCMLSANGTIPWAGILDWWEGESVSVSAHLSASRLWLQCEQWPHVFTEVTSTLPC